MVRKIFHEVCKISRWIWDPFWTTWTLLTIFRSPFPFQEIPERAPIFFGVVGFLRGIFLWIVAEIIVHLLPGKQWVWALAVTVGEVVFTGALHIDGWADSWDAFFGHRDRDKILRILKDVHLGVWGGTALFLDLFSRITLLATLPEELFRSVFFFFPLAGTGAILWTMAFLPYARGEEGFSFHFGKRKRFVWIGLGINILLYGGAGVLFAPGFPILLPLGIVFSGITIWIGYQAYRISGYTGDTLGASHEGGILLWLWALHFVVSLGSPL